MSMFANATAAPAPQTKNSGIIALFYAVLLMVMVVGQLFAFEKFIPLIESFGLPGGHGMATLVAGTLVVSEVFALPFLLRMRVSPLMRLCSMALGWVVAILWLVLSFWLNITNTMSENIGFLGTKVTLPVGWWAVFYAAALVVLAAWASWGLWPLKKHRSTR